MTPRHRLVVRQIARHVPPAVATAPEIQAFLDVVSQAYTQADDDRKLLERSLALTSQELLARNQELAAAMRQAALSFWAWDVRSQQLTIQGYGPVGFPEVRGMATISLPDVLARVVEADRDAVAADLTAGARDVDVVFRVGAGDRWVRMRGQRDPLADRLIGVWADVTDETRVVLEEQRRRERTERQNRTLQRLAELLVEGVELPSALAQVCADLCATLEVAAASVWLLSDDGRQLECTIRYDHAAATAGAPVPPPLRLVEAPRYLQMLTSARAVAMADVQTDVAAIEIAARAAALGARALLGAPCRSGRQLVGVVCCEHGGAPRTWRSEEVSFVASVADGVSLAIEGRRRSRAERERATLEEGLRQAQKMESLGHLAGGVAHDLNNLLTPILICGELLREDLADAPDSRESIDTLLAAASSARELVAQLLAFGRKQMLQLRTIDVNDVCERAVKLLARSLPESIDVRLQLASALPPISADATQLQQVIVNLAINARDAMPAGGRLTVSTAAAFDDGTAGVVIAVEDSGAGIDPQTLPHIFEPFFTTKAAGRGTGLGLAMVYGIVKQHHGTIEVASEVGRGTRFEVRLPFADRSRASSGGMRLPAERRRPALASTILVVEDDHVVLDLVTAVLRREGFEVITAAEPAVAIELAGAHADRLDLVLTDVVMPQMNGVQMFEQVARRCPRTRVVYMSGYGQDALAAAGEIALLQKPFTIAGLVAAVRGALAAPRPHA